MHSPPDDAPHPIDAAADGPTDSPPSGDVPETTEAASNTSPTRPKRPLFRRRPRGDEAATTPPESDAHAPVDTTDADQPTEAVELPPQPPLNPGRMRRERRRLVSRRQETVYHLGGLAFELFRRDMLTEPVMRRRAEEVADIDRAVIAIDEQLVTLDETRRTRREERNAERREARARQRRPSGYCLSCGAPYRDPVNFCANCGSPVIRPTPEADDGDQPTTAAAVETGSGSTEIIDTPPTDDGTRP